MAKILSVEIDNRNIKILEGSRKGTSILIYNSIFLDVPSGCIDDGRIIDMDLLAGTIEKELIQYKIRTKNAIFTINTNSTITRNIELPLLKSKSETMSMIKNELEQLVAADLNQYKLVYKETEKFKEDEIEKCKYIVYGLPTNMYEQYIELSQRLKLEMTALDLTFNSLDKISENKLLINGVNFKQDSVAAFIDISYNTIGFSVVNYGKNDFSRNSSGGIRDIARNFATIFNLNQDEAIDKVSNLNLIEDHDQLLNISKINTAQESINQWIDEFNRYIRYYNSINKERQIEKIYLYGAYANIKGLDQYLESHMNIDVELIKEISGLVLKDKKLFFDVKLYFSALLSLYINKKDINFLSDKKKKRKSVFNVGIILLALILILVLIPAYYLYSYIVRQTALEKELQTINNFIENEENIKLNEEAELLISKVNLLEQYAEDVKTALNAIDSEDAVTTAMFEEIAKAATVGTRVNTMSIDISTIQMQCSSSSRNEIAQFEKNLKNIEFINNVYIPAVVEGTEGGSTVYSYSVVCEIKGVSTDEAK